jgi:hypothetical protein
MKGELDMIFLNIEGTLALFLEDNDKWLPQLNIRDAEICTDLVLA